MDFGSRIDLRFGLEKLSILICKIYNLGKFKKNQLIEVGYEDYNYILFTTKEKVFVKVFSKERTDELCKELVERQSIPYYKGFSCPQIFKNKEGSELSIISLNDTKFRLCVMEYINGVDFFRLSEMPNDQELKDIAKQLAILNKIDYKPNFIYDKWAIINFAIEYENNKEYVPNNYKQDIDLIYNDFKNIDFTKLTYGFVHGDIIVTNIIKQKGKLTFIDFSVSNYQPRLVDLAVTICDLCIDTSNFLNSQEKINIFLNEYNKNSKLSDYEIKVLPLFLKVHQAQTILQTNKELVKYNNKSNENLEFLEKGEKGLKFLKNLSINIP